MRCRCQHHQPHQACDIKQFVTMALLARRAAVEVVTPALRRYIHVLSSATLARSARTSSSSSYVARAFSSQHRPTNAPHTRYHQGFANFSSFASSPKEQEQPQEDTAVEPEQKPIYDYALAAAYTAKDVPYNPIRNVTTFTAPKEPPTPRKGRLPRNLRPASGQDAYFITQRQSSPASYAFGVADGVGGWADSGVDPADFSHAFCENMASVYRNTSPASLSSAQKLMQIGYDSVLADKTISAGGSTACIAVASPKGCIEIANLGDSGFMHIRTGAIRHASEPQIHAFNTPYQLAVIPESMRKRTQAFGGTQLCDMPRDSAVSRHAVKHGDVLVLATDGVWDNIAPSDVLQAVGRIMVTAGAWEDKGRGIVVADSLRELTDVQINDINREAVEKGEFDGKVGGRKTREEGIRGLQGYLAAAIAGEAKVASENHKRDGPFAKEVQKYYPEEMWHGGKVDDICVVVVVAVEEGK